MSVDHQLEQPETLDEVGPATLSNKKGKPEKNSSLDARLTALMRYLLDKQIHFVVIALAVLYLAYSWFSVQSRYAQLQATDFDNSKITFSKGNTAINFYRDTASNRPAISSNVGDTLLEFNDLDSSITINGISTKLWDTDHTYQTDAANAKFYHSMQRDQWVLFQEITLTGSNKVLVEYYYRNDATASDVTLQISHNHSFWGAAQLNDSGFKSVLSSNQYTNPDEQAQHPRYSLALKLNTTAFGSFPFTSKVTEGSRANGSLQSILTSYNFREIPPNQRTLVASEEISWQNTPLTP